MNNVINRHGIKLFSADNSADAIKNSGLDWDVVLDDVKIASSGQIIPKKKVIIRKDTNTPLNIVGSTYTPVQNRKTFSIFDKFKDKLTYERGASLKGGQIVFVQARINDKKQTLQLDDNDETRNYLTIVNSFAHKNNAAMKIYITPIRMSCFNMFNLSIDECVSCVSIIHTKSIDEKLKHIESIFEDSITYFNDFSNLATKLNDVKLKTNDDIIYTYLDAVIGKESDELSKRENKNITTKKDNILDFYENEITKKPASLWHLFNATIEYIDHTIGKDDDKRLFSSLFSAGAKLKQTAYYAVADFLEKPRSNPNIVTNII